ncbi:MAG: AbrB/MazE/SpoVT family DNA-binding domain-containing protein [Eubacteriales bacterium]|nr:AbrB/MazE/SpoVT family DNA-binding domain-containing protein [Eubacteriales bacterium]
MQRKLCTRKVDELGRVVLPQEARTALGIKEKQSFDIYIDEDIILLKINNDIPVCCLCGESEVQLMEVNHSLLCNNCIAKIKEI